MKTKTDTLLWIPYFLQLLCLFSAPVYKETPWKNVVEATSLPPLLSLTVSSPEVFVLNALLGVSLSCQIHQPILFLSDFLYSIWHPLLETPFLLALRSCCLASCSFPVFFTSSIDFNVAPPSAFSSFYFITLSASVISTSLMATNNTCILTVPKYVS